MPVKTAATRTLAATATILLSLPWAASGVSLREGAHQKPATLAAAPNDNGSVRYADYVYSGHAFSVPEDYALRKVTGCEDLRLMVPEKDLLAFEAQPEPKSLLSLLNTDGFNVFECAGEQVVKRTQFLVLSEPKRLYVASVENPRVQTDVPWPKRFDGVTPVATATETDSESAQQKNSATKIAPEQLVSDVAGLLVDSFASRDEQVNASLVGGQGPMHRKVQYGTLTRDVRADGQQIGGGWYDGTFFYRPTLYKSPLITVSDLETTAAPNKGTSCNTTSYAYLDGTQTSIGGTTSAGNSTGDDCGHMLAKRLSGSGTYNGAISQPTTIFTQTSSINQNDFRLYEDKLYKLVNCNSCGVGSEAYMSLGFNYQTSNQRRASSEVYRVWCSSSTDLTCRSRMAANFGTNPAASSTSKTFQNPWQPYQVYQLESSTQWTMSNVNTYTSYPNYTGGGYRYITATGNMTFSKYFPTPGTTYLYLNYGNTESNTVKVYLDNVYQYTQTFPALPTWGTWSCASIQLNINDTERHYIKLEGSTNATNLRIDSAVLTYDNLGNSCPAT